MKSISALVFSALLLAGCETTKPMPPTPVEPAWITLSRPPVVAVYTNGTFIVTDELVERSAQQEDFVKRFRRWKLDNNLP